MNREDDRKYMAEVPILEVKNLSKQYKGFLLDNVSFVLPKGYIMGYVGPNGAGKSTTLGLITQTRRADEGVALLDGKRYEEDPILYKEKIGYVSSVSYFSPTTTVKDAALLLGQFYPTFSKEKFYHYVKVWDLPEKKKFSAFSTGMMVKLMFAAVLSRQTRLLILDEATNGLDILFREEILKLLQRYIEDGEHSVLFATHILDDLEQIADYIVMVEDGRVLLQDTKEALTENYILVKGDESLLAGEGVKYLLGAKRSAYGFSALIKADNAALLPAGTVMEKPNVSQIMSYLMKGHEKLEIN
ncbi:MAG: ABC transporter ATP-binding protein [Lachnospiraceae bacterium]|nr:ABC transporter ATP-binding protein [Lachnospiraceae bacterium]